jgi:FtsP/CotA-like multicopper oxidase with cupredoxin domain
MKNRNIFSRQPMSLAVMLALTTSAGLQVAHAGAGWGDSADIYGNPMKTPTYYANSPSGLLPAEDCFITTPAASGAFDTASLSVPLQPSATEFAANPPSTCDTGTALRKFVDTLPGLNTVNNLGNSIPVAVPEKDANGNSPYPGSDYYEIAVVEYTQQMHSDLAKPTTLRGYVQISANGTVALKNIDGSPILLPNGNPAMAMAKPSYLGPIISSTTGTPTRLKFYNLLPAGTKGNLHLPVDETITGAGTGPDGVSKYQQNRVEIHLHGGDNPWISDGTPHQWILPAADETALKNAGHPEMARGVSAKNVPDMPDPGPGAMTYYFPNGQGGRLMFYHDHAIGLTRLNVYAGVAAGYLLNDLPGVGENYPDLANLLPPATEQIPLIIQDKTFVPKDIAMQDAKWDTKMGQEGDLWYPHVYETNQDPNSYDGTNPVGRWDWGNWFWPVFPSVYDLPTGEIKAVNTMTNLSEVSTTPEAFMDTPVVNGTAYPTLKVDPKAYRFRVLNAGNDRFLNLGLYLATDKQTTDGTNPLNSHAVVCDGVSKRNDAVAAVVDSNGNIVTPAVPASVPSPADCTEVKMVNFDASYNAPNAPYTPDGTMGFPTTGGIAGTGWGAQVGGLFPQGAPDPATAGPHIIQIGNETGLLANPLDIPSTPLNYEYNKRSVTVLNVLERGLYLGNAERADVLIDFSQYAGKTLILYNDAPAPVPASDPRIDYYTGNGDNTAVGGAPNTKPGFGPNTRTIMQIVVSGTPDTAAKTNPTPALVSSLQTALPKAYATTQAKPIVPEPEYNAAFANDPAYSPVAPAARYNARIYTGSVYNTGATPGFQGVKFNTPEAITYFPAPTCTVATGTAATTCSSIVAAQQAKANGGLVTTPAGGAVNAYVQSKAIQELFDPAYGRMNATLGVELPFTSALTQTTIPLGYVDPATETVADGETQFWKITHNGVDTHPVHFHLVNLQVINRIGWDGTIKAPYGDEAGWKETVKMNPLEDVVVAVRAKKPTLQGIANATTGAPIASNAFGLPTSSRLMDPSQPAGSLIGFTQIDPATGVPAVKSNQIANFGWEYVWHCHILGHEENDFMRPVIFNANELAAAAPTGLTATANANSVLLSWTDVAKTEYAYKVERGLTTTTTTTVRGRPVTTTSTVWTDLTKSITPAQQVVGAAPLANANTFTDTEALVAGTAYQYRVTAVGANGNGVAPAISYTVASQPPVAPSNLTATQSAASIVLSWTDNSTNENNFAVWRSLNGAAPTQIGTPAVTRTGTAITGTGGTVTYTDSSSLVEGTYTYYVIANKTSAPVAASAKSNVATVNFVAPAIPAAPSNLGVTWTRAGLLADNATLTWTDNSNNETGFTIQRATNAAFTSGLNTTTVAANVKTLTQTGLLRTITYYYRVASANGTVLSAWNTAAGSRAP